MELVFTASHRFDASPPLLAMDQKIGSHWIALVRHAVGTTRRGAEAAKHEREALLLFKAQMGSYVRLYAFLSQIFDYGATDIEARSLFYRRLIPLLEFGRERSEVDLSKVKLTHHKLTAKSRTDLTLGKEPELLKPATEAGTGSVQDKERALLAEIVAKMNDLFGSDLSGNDQFSYAMTLKGKLLDNPVLVQQAINNSEDQFHNSPTLSSAVTEAVMDALDTHTEMSKRALSSLIIQEGVKSILMGPGRLYASLRQQAVVS